ncbi:stage II sporulation protein D [Pontibacillus sp. HMF3514]|uniref:stage II sporulation protein D n=1 Tax=Pontibacillus sp. HMF3514 TaxID=2692425 RepID=UPI0013203A22|nr:stage II sporulation protein D [Pontibacillus sp. HMF3514]QHE53780.1 stage II sporulation protein D [Pontibacillus sp. HMF3514]
MKAWKGPGLLLIGTLVLIILVVPTLIVLPFIQPSDPIQQVATEGSTTPTKPVETLKDFNLDDLSSFSVNVYRTKAEQVEQVPLELYVSHVVASEMPADFELEALKAQSLAARTYIVQHLIKSEEDIPGNAHVTDTIQHQVYKNNEELMKAWGPDYIWKMNKIKQAVAETKGEILTYEGSPITASFFSTSNGYTENSEDYWEHEFPYLRSVESPWDTDSPKYLDQKVFTMSEIEQKLGVQLEEDQPIITSITKTDSERINTAKVGGKTFTGREIREYLNLKSSDFTVQQKNQYIIFKTKGYGHGVGMSQYGANGMAREGKGYKDIVGHYYNDVAITEIDTFLPQIASR